MKPEYRIYGGRLNAYDKHVEIREHLEPEEFKNLDGARVLVVPETHHLYDFLECYIERRDWFEKQFGGERA